MVLGFILLGWVGGFAVAVMYLAFAGGTILGAFGLFLITANLVALSLAVFSIRRLLWEERGADLAGAVVSVAAPHRQPRPADVVTTHPTKR